MIRKFTNPEVSKKDASVCSCGSCVCLPGLSPSALEESKEATACVSIKTTFAIWKKIIYQEEKNGLSFIAILKNFQPTTVIQIIMWRSAFVF